MNIQTKKAALEVWVNGAAHAVDPVPGQRLSDLLREGLGQRSGAMQAIVVLARFCLMARRYAPV